MEKKAKTRVIRNLTTKKKETMKKLARVVNSDANGLQTHYLLGYIKTKAER